MGIIPNYALDNAPTRAKILLGKLEHKENGVVTNEYSRMYDKSRYAFMLDADFEISNDCCAVMKKGPLKKFAKETGKVPMTAQMASESRLRTQQWIKSGCNSFDNKRVMSNPMSFWTEQDVLLYIKENGNAMVQRRIEIIEESNGCTLEDIIDSKTGKQKYNREEFTPICSVYGDIVVDDTDNPGQISIADIASDVGLFDLSNPPLKTTGCNRTGCMFCGFGCHLEKEGEGRFELMKTTHPKQYDYIMRPKEQGGLNYKEVIDWVNEHGNMHIRY